MKQSDPKAGGSNMSSIFDPGSWNSHLLLAFLSLEMKISGLYVERRSHMKFNVISIAVEGDVVLPEDYWYLKKKNS